MATASTSVKVVEKTTVRLAMGPNEARLVRRLLTFASGKNVKTLIRALNAAGITWEEARKAYPKVSELIPRTKH